MKKRKFGLLLLTSLLASCNSANATDGFGYELDFEKGYNKNLWFKNDLETKCADPSVIYCAEDSYYYMYITSDDLGSTGFNVYRSKQLNYWEKLPPAFTPDPYSWGIINLWAPNAIKIGNKYYLYYSAYNHTTGKKGISVAVADTPAGPFHEYEGTDYYGNIITRSDQIFDFGFSTIDAAPFIDDNGDLYLYFAKDQVSGISTSCGVKLLDAVTADYSTVTELAYPGKPTLDGPTIIEWERATNGMWNEAPFMIKLNGKYYLTYSANPYWDVSYGVGYAVGDSPLGTFTKPTDYENENLLLGVEPAEVRSDWDFMSGTGHHCFFYAGNELMIGYHAHMDRYYGNSRRAFAIDRVIVDDDGMFVNGPTWSLVALPESVSGYKNIASDATLKIDGQITDSKLLVDGKIPMHKFRSAHVNLQEKFTSGKHTIEFEFDKTYKATAVAIYNSLDYETRVNEVESVSIEGYGSASNVGFNKEYLKNYLDQDIEYLRPGCPYIVEFNETDVNKVSITVSGNTEFALSDIVILGR